MRLRLGEILVQEGSCSAADVQDALRNQVIFGGRLGTNLLELGAVTEEVLAAALGKLTGAPALHGELAMDAKAIQLLDRRLAERWDVVPFLLADRRLALLARDPFDLQMLDEVAFATGKQVHAFVVPEARVWRALHVAYGVSRELRGLDLGWHAASGRAVPAAAPGRGAAEGPDLMDEAEFQDLYGQRAGPTPTPVPPPATPAAGPPPGPPPLSEPPLLVPVEELPFLTLEVLAEIEAGPGHQPPLALEPATPPAGPAGGEGAEPSPLSFGEAVRFLEGVAERGTIARTVLRYARSRFARAVLLTVRRGEACGWAGLGGGLTVEAVHRLRLPLGVPGVVDTVVSTRAHYLGPLPKTSSNIRLLKGLGGGVPQSALLVPILALGKVVNVLYADAGRARLVDGSDLGELLILASRISQSYDDLARRAV
jgi:type II secretion system (T2SS) protein E